MGMVYQWKDGAKVKIDPQVAGTRLEAIRVRNNGQLTPRAVVDDAKKKTSPLHEFFEWNDVRAAKAHREDQARYLIRSVVIAPQDVERAPLRAYVNVTTEKHQHYTSLEAAMTNEDHKAQVLQRAWRQLQSWRQTYSGLSEFADLFKQIDRLDIA